MEEFTATVTGMEEFSRNRYRIYLDEQFAFVLYKGELSSLGITIGAVIDETTYNTICRSILPLRAKKRCMNLLKARAYTEKALRDKLREGGYPEESIEEALLYVKSYGYVDDLEYAREYIRCNKDKRSRKGMEEKLRQKGISARDLEKAFVDSYEAEEEELLQHQLACSILRKKKYDPASCDQKERQRIYAALLRKGLSAETIRMAMERFSP